MLILKPLFCCFAKVAERNKMAKLMEKEKQTNAEYKIAGTKSL